MHEFFFANVMNKKGEKFFFFSCSIIVKDVSSKLLTQNTNKISINVYLCDVYPKDIREHNKIYFELGEVKMISMIIVPLLHRSLSL